MHEHVTSTLPHHEPDHGVTIESMDRLVDALAVEHARLLHKWTPIAVSIRGPLDPSDLERAAARRALRNRGI